VPGWRLTRLQRLTSFNRYRRSIAGDEEWWRFHALGKPALIGEPRC
jgi:hypothetical protein